ncbi:MAG: hypothetical protein KA104_02145 [Candidatus Pacebacteria bacterium]|nr:hypothetical protein [Candidatus Paceibacterota bacterium]
MITKFLPIICVLIAGAIFFGYINPTVMGAISATNKQIKQYDAALSAAQRFEQKQAQLTTEVKALPQDGVARLEAFLPDGVDNVQLILDLDAVATRSNIKLFDFVTTEVKGGQSSSVDANGTPTLVLDNGQIYDSLDLSMSGTGTYAQFRTFLDAVETSLRPLDLVEFHLSDAGGTPGGGYKYDMTFRLYWLR